MGGTCAGGVGARPQAGPGDDAAVLVNVRLGEIPRDTSPAEGQIVKVDAATARELEASGQAVPVNAEATRAK